ncbi:hypothetical protein RUND412_007693 [Rhizina undulata]
MIKIVLLWLSSFFLLVGLILTTVLLAGTTSDSVRNVYLVKISYTTPASAKIPQPMTGSNGTFEAQVEISPTGTLAPSTSASTHAGATKSTTSVMIRTTTITSGTSTSARADQLSVRDNRGIDIKVPDFWDPDSVLLHRKNEHLEKRQNSGTQQVADVHLTVLVSYYGLCASSNFSSYTCTSQRHRNSTLLYNILFPPQPPTYNPTFTTASDPEDLLGLSLALQKSLSPFPLILALILLGISFILISLFAANEGDIIGITIFRRLITRRILTCILVGGSIFLLLSVALFQSTSGMAKDILQLADTGNNLGISAEKGKPAISVGWAAVSFVWLSLLLYSIILFIFDINGKWKDLDADEESLGNCDSQHRPLELIDRVFKRKSDADHTKHRWSEFRRKSGYGEGPAIPLKSRTRSGGGVVEIPPGETPYPRSISESSRARQRDDAAIAWSNMI